MIFTIIVTIEIIIVEKDTHTVVGGPKVAECCGVVWFSSDTGITIIS